MTRLQLTVIGLGVGLFGMLYFGFDTIPQKQKLVEQSRSFSTESANVEVLVRDAKSALSPVQSNAILVLETELESITSDSLRVSVFESLSGKWFEFGHPAIAGVYAQQIAELIATEESWSIAATTFTICTQRTEEKKIREFCSGRAVSAFENAISINPENIQHKVNLALSYAETPPSENPMKGVTMLLGLNKDFPDNVLVLNSLGRLAIKTGQYDRAVTRLEHALSKSPEDTNTNCLLAQAYQGLGDIVKAGQFKEKCEQLIN